MTDEIIDPNEPTMLIEMRPSSFTGHSWWLVLKYKDQSFDELLPYDYPSMAEDRQALALAEPAERLRLKMKDVLDAEETVRADDAKPEDGAGAASPTARDSDDGC